MNSKNVIPHDCLPAYSPLARLAMIWLLLDRFKVGDLGMGMFYTLAAIWMIHWIASFWTEKARPLVGYGREH